MPFKTKTRRTPKRISHQRMTPSELPELGMPLTLICGPCGTEGDYHVGRIILNEKELKKTSLESFADAVGFTGYIRCHQCEAGGPWNLPEETIYTVMAISIAAADKGEETPIILGGLQTFDGRLWRYATDAEAHLQGLIESDPDNAFLWVRLGNLYKHGGAKDRAREAYERAIELDPTDIEAHGSLGDIRFQDGRYRESVPHWHAVLKHVRNARHVHYDIRRIAARMAIESLLEVHLLTNEDVELLPRMDGDEAGRDGENDPRELELVQLDLECEEDLEVLCDMFVEEPRGLFGRRRKKWARKKERNQFGQTVRGRERAVGRNDPCTCGSGRKYKKCCGRTVAAP